VFDGNNRSVAFVCIFFRLFRRTITNENGRFYLESDEAEYYNHFFIGYELIELSLESKVNLDLKLILNEAAAQLDLPFTCNRKTI
jgi:hypothetical protein